MNIISKLFVILNEILLSLMVLLPIPFVIFFILKGAASSLEVLWLVLGVLGYYVLVVILFGWLALVIENNRSLKQVVSLLEAQEDKRKVSEAYAKKEPTMRTSMRREPTIAPK